MDIFGFDNFKKPKYTVLASKELLENKKSKS